jgi:hypothetical protein
LEPGLYSDIRDELRSSETGLRWVTWLEWIRPVSRGRSTDPIAIRERGFNNPSSLRFGKKENSSMEKLRRLLWSLSLIALVGLMPSETQAGPITLSVDLDGVEIFSFSSVAPDQNVLVPTAAVNAALTAAGSAYQFISLSAQSNYTGTTFGSLQTTFQLNTSGPGDTSAVLSIDTDQSGFLSPTGPLGSYNSSVGGQYSNATGSLSFTSDFQGVNGPTLPIAISGTNSYSAATGDVPVGAVPSGYELSNHFLISLTQTPTTFLGGTGGIELHAAIPEPSSVVMFLTAMPLPLVLVGLARRRRALARS